ncbi:winged helix-turn-helix transcriptional regulator [Actinosynnema sp. ALI-1.44]|uniref:winged helix-turn-helix transcriptional regulator n=1 Tax=Actinosynnema sp. ALI-1.44 TaxID=1933779 RepID=UPI001EDC568D|nr:helix-turn-helix domain-containing protein [Actinosynnema sp. ALI-1.44]
MPKPGLEPYDKGETFRPGYHHAVEMIGKRWNGVILRELLRGASRYSQLRSAIPSLTDKMLAGRLQELEAEGMVTRTVVDSVPVRVEYALTEKGRDLEATITVLGEWADRWYPDGPDRPVSP